MPIIEREQLCRLIPHAGSMCLLDNVLEWDENKILCSSRSHWLADHPLIKNGALSSVHAIEYGAQAMAVHGGLLAQQQNESLLPGYLAAIRDIQIKLPTLQDIETELKVSATKMLAQGGSLMYQFEVRDAAQLIVSGRVTVIQMQGAAA